MINELVRAMLLTIQNSNEYKLFPAEDKKRMKEIMDFVGGEEVDAMLEGMMDMDAPNQHYQLKVTLKGAKPPIWRRIIIPGYYTFEELHFVIQEAMGWEDYHLYSFECGDLIIDSQPEEDDPFGGLIAMRPKLDATDTMVAELLLKEGDKCHYTYDFGDDWEHTVVLEKILPSDEERQLPVCLMGKRACPPEDCGGIHGYKSMLATLEGPDTDEKAHLLEWLGTEKFDPEAFDIDMVNTELRRLGSELEENLQEDMKGFLL